MNKLSRTLSEEAEKNLSKLKEKLRELFQLDRGDLGFGLYRVMALKSNEVNKFLNVLAITGTTAKGENCLILCRNLKKTNNTKLEKWLVKHQKDFGDDFDLIYVNDDHALNAIKKPNNKWEAITTEPTFRELMFAGAV